MAINLMNNQNGISFKRNLLYNPISTTNELKPEVKKEEKEITANPVPSTQNNSDAKVNNSSNEEVKNDKKKIAMTVGALAAIGIAAVALATKGNRADKLADIKFDKGIARLKNGKKFTGTINDVLKNGDKIQLTYEDGKIISSTREGLKNFTKNYSYLKDSFGRNNTFITALNKEGEKIYDAQIGEKGELFSKIFADGSSKTYKNGILDEEKLVSGTRIWHNKKLENLTFNKGIAYINSGEKFTGTINDVLKDGDKIQLTYEDGKIISSTREGLSNFTKNYEHLKESGEKFKTIEKFDKEGNFISESTISEKGKTFLQTLADGTEKAYKDGILITE